MSDFRYLDYEGLATYTEHVKGYADGKIVYISDESEIPDPPKEGTLYVIGSEILMDEEIIIGTQAFTTSSWTGKSIDTRLHNGKRIAYYLPYTSYAGTVASLTLELSDEDNTTVQSRIYANGTQLDQTIPGGCVIRMMYFENIVMNGSTISGWICDAILDNSQKNYEVSVDLSTYTGESSFSTNLSATTQGISAFNVGDKIRIKSSLNFPTNQLPIQARVYAPGFDITSHLLGPGGVSVGQYIGVLRWPTANDADTLTALYEYYNTGYPFPEHALLKYGGFIDTIVIGLTRTSSGAEYICAPLFNNGCGYIAANAANATNASKVNISTSTSSSSYPLVFTNNITAGNKSLYTDSLNSLYYNPSSNTLTVPTVSITSALTAPTAKASTIANKTSGNTIVFDDCIKIKTSSHVQGLMNFKGSDHNNDVLYVSGGSTTSAPSIVIKTKNNKDYVGISMVGKADTTSAAEIKVYGASTTSYTTIQGGKNAVVTSDERLKDFGDNIEVDFNELKQIPKKYFTWKNDEIKSSNIGTSAQSIEKLYPELVITDDNGYKSLDYSTLSIVALAAIDKLNERIEYLENKLKEYEK